MAYLGQLGPTDSSVIGSALGTGIGQGLSSLANFKLQQLLSQQQAGRIGTGLEALGFAPQEAQSLSFLPESVLKEITKQRLVGPQQEAYAQALQELLGGAPQQQGMEALGGLGQQVQPQQQMMQPGQVAEPAIAQALAKPRLTERQATELAKLGMKKQEQQSKQKTEAFKLTKDERKDILEKSRAARQDLHDLERLEDLEQEGKLDTPGYVEFLKRSGLDIPALMNPGSEEFNKIAYNFMRNAKTYLGARISNFELEQFLKTIPSLSQSPEGRKRVISNLKYMSRSALEYNDALKEVIAENKGIPPLDLSEKIDDKIEKRLDKIAKKLKEDLAKPVPSGQNKFITGLQSALGTIIGAPGKLLSGIGGAAKGVELLGAL